jgi:hypothetical protein
MTWHDEPPTGHSPSQPKAEVVESAVDYLTVTCADRERRKELSRLGYELFADARSLGNDPRPFNWLGYEGLHCGGVTTADREDTAMLRLSGPLAASHWQAAAELADNVSRVDLAVTARFPEPVRDVATVGFVSAKAMSAARGRELDLQLIIGNKPGSTLYLGKRTSELFARLYDKEAESRDPRYRNCWRWELEAKGKRAGLAVGLLRRNPETSGAVASIVFEHFVTRGVSCPFSPGRVVGLPCPPARETDDERRLRWLSDQIRPVVAKLQARVPRERVVKALGLNDARPPEIPPRKLS